MVIEDKKAETPTKALESPKSPTDSFSSVDYEALDKDWSFGVDDCVVIEPAPSTTVAAVETPAGEPELGHRRSLAKVFGVKTIAVATRKCKQLGPLARLMEQNRWEEIHKAYGSYISSLKDRLQITDDCILLDNRVVIPQHMRKFLLDAIHDTHPGFQTMKMLTQDVWWPNIHRDIG